MNIKKLAVRYRHAWVLLYGFIYIPWFMWLEKNITSDYHIIHMALDDYIPFVEYFIVPYTLWFIYIAATLAYFFFKDTPGFYRLSIFLFSGMTVFLVISTLIPNGLNLRPETFAHDNVFVDMVKALYLADTPTNVLPSIHVFNSVGVCIAIWHNASLWKYKVIRYGSLILSTLIVLSTMFLKQHSVIDVAVGIALSVVLYAFVYAREPKMVTRVSREPLHSPTR